jgi:hypothetical protein
LWAHRNEQIRVARQLINILPSVGLIEMLRYLIEDYWGRRAGWPDLLVSGVREYVRAMSSIDCVTCTNSPSSVSVSAGRGLNKNHASAPGADASSISTR